MAFGNSNIKTLGVFRSWKIDGLLKRLFKNAGILLSGNIAAAILGLVALALTTRALGTESFGILVLISTYVQVIDRVVNFQSWQALVKYGAEVLDQSHKEDFKSLLKFGFTLDIGTAIAGTLLAASGAWCFGQWQNWDPDTVLMVTFYSTTILFHIEGVPTAILRLFDRFKLFSLITSAAAMIKLVGVILAFITGVGLWAFVVIWAITDIFGKMLLVILSLRELKRNNYRNLRHSTACHIATRFPGIWGFFISTNLNSSIRMAYGEADVLVIGAVLGPAAVGFYKLAKQIANVLGILNGPLYQSIYPELAKLRVKNDNCNFVRLAIRSSAFSGALALLFWIILAVLAEPFICHVFGSQFVAVKGVLLWYSSAVVIAVVGFPLTPMMLAFGKPQIAFWNYLFSTIVYFPVLYWLITIHGLIGAGMAYVVFYIIWSLLTFLSIIFFLKKEGF